MKINKLLLTTTLVPITLTPALVGCNKPEDTAPAVILSEEVKDQGVSVKSFDLKEGQISNIVLNLPGDKQEIKWTLLNIGDYYIGSLFLYIDKNTITIPAIAMTTNKVVIESLWFDRIPAEKEVVIIGDRKAKQGQATKYKAVNSYGEEVYCSWALKDKDDKDPDESIMAMGNAITPKNWSDPSKTWVLHCYPTDSVSYEQTATDITIVPSGPEIKFDTEVSTDWRIHNMDGTTTKVPRMYYSADMSPNQHLGFFSPDFYDSEMTLVSGQTRTKLVRGVSSSTGDYNDSRWGDQFNSWVFHIRSVTEFKDGDYIEIKLTKH